MRARVAVAALVLVATSGCGPTVDLRQGLQVLEVTSGWSDGGRAAGKNKLVPILSFRLKNVSDQSLKVLQVNTIFRRMNEPEDWGSGFQTVVGSEGLLPGATTPVITVVSELGYTGTESHPDMLQNQHFVDATARLFAKYGSVQWQLLGEYPVERSIVTRTPATPRS